MTSVLAYRPRRHLQSRRAPLARSRASSLNERLVCEPLARSPVYEAVKPRQRVVLDRDFVKPEREFVNVAVQVPRAGMITDADEAAF